MVDTVSIEPLDGCLLVTFKAGLTAQRMIDTYRRLEEDTRYRDGWPTVWDMREIDITDLNYDELSVVSSYDEGGPNREGFRVGVVASDDAKGVILKILVTMYDADQKQTLQIFPTIDAAEDWVLHR